MKRMPIGVMYRCDNPPENLPAYARLAERLGYDELWVVEDCFFTGAVSAAAVALAATDALTVGIGIMPAAFRNPALAAMELSNLSRLFPGRILPGFGHGVEGWLRQVGAEHRSPLALLGETVEAVRALLAGQTVTVTGRYVRLAEVGLAFSPVDVPPVALGVRSEKSLRLSGQLADGAVLAEGSSPAYVRWARDLIDEGRRKAGRDDDHRLTVYVDFEFDDSRRSARLEIARRIVDGQPLPRPDDDLSAEVADLLASRPNVNALADMLPDEYVDRFAVAGSPRQCGQAVAALRDAGADAVVLVPPRDPQLAVAQLTLAADELLPLLRDT